MKHSISFANTKIKLDIKIVFLCPKFYIKLTSECFRAIFQKMSFYLSWMCRNRGRMGYNKIYNFKTFYNCNRTVCSRLWSIWVLVEPNIIQLYNLKPASSQAVVKIQQKFTSLVIVTGSSHIPSFFDSYNIFWLFSWCVPNL